MPGRGSSSAWDSQRLADPHGQPDKAARVRWMFDAIAPTYELVNHLASAGMDRRWRRQMVRVAGVRPDDTLLDVACGTGDVYRAFAAARPAPRGIVGADFALRMLERARLRGVSRRDSRRRTTPPAPPYQGGERMLPYQGGERMPLYQGGETVPPCHGGDSLRRVTLCQADAAALPFADESFTLVTCAFGIRNFQDLETGLREMWRVLRPGGRAVVLEFGVPSLRLVRALYLLYFNRLMPLGASVVSRDRSGAYRYLPRSVLSFHDQVGIVSCFRQGGFAEVSVFPQTLGIVSIYRACK